VGSRCHFIFLGLSRRALEPSAFWCDLLDACATFYSGVCIWWICMDNNGQLEFTRAYRTLKLVNLGLKYLNSKFILVLKINDI